MANQRGTFAKRQREMDLKDKARAKEARRAAKKDENRPTKGPQIDWAQPGGVSLDDGRPAPTASTASTSRPVVTQARPSSPSGSARPGATPARPGSTPGDAAQGDQSPDAATDKPTE